MKITDETAAQLGDKLASLDLTEEQGQLLCSLLAAEDEVSGFGFDKMRHLPRVLGPLPGAWKVEEGTHWKVEEGTHWKVEEGEA